jgi:hypothetical protein
VREVASLSSVGRAPDCSCVKTNVSADIRVSPVQVWERGPHLQRSASAWSTHIREVDRHVSHPLSWERGLITQPYGMSPLNREVERLQTLPLSWWRRPHFHCPASSDLIAMVLPLHRLHDVPQTTLQNDRIV